LRVDFTKRESLRWQLKEQAMKMKDAVAFTLGLLLVCLMTSRGAGQTRLPGPPREGDERLVAPLVNAGIALNEPSLIAALKNNDSNIAARAAGALARFPKTRRLVHALEAALSDDRDIVAMRAGYSLFDLNERAWVMTGVTRLPQMHNPLVQLQFAGLLARAGNTAGWPIVVSGILEEQFTPVALENIQYFNGKIGPNGQPIRVVEELERLSNGVPEGSRRLIEEKLNQLRTNR
jgi:hypothetical protein